MEDDRYLPVPGYPHYRVDPATKEVQSDQSGQWKAMKPYEATGTVELKDNDHKPKVMRVARIAYAALHGLNPAKIAPTLIVREVDGELRLLDRAGFAALARSCKPRYDADSIKRKYEESAQFGAAVMRAYQSGDYGGVLAALYKHEDRLRAFICKRFAICGRRLDEMAAQCMSKVLGVIMGRRGYVLDPWNYLRVTAQSIYATERQRRKQTVSYDGSPTAATVARI